MKTMLIIKINACMKFSNNKMKRRHSGRIGVLVCGEIAGLLREIFQKRVIDIVYIAELDDTCKKLN